MSDATQLDTIKNTAARRQLAKLGQLVRECQQTIAEQNLLKAGYLADMGAIADKLNLTNVATDDWALFKKRGSKRLDRRLLLENGATTEMIENSLVQGDDYWSLRGKGGGDSDE